jgi:coenzyme F420-0:L-glutamate ligase / coenzyme F420-1:gamma-L-glutamate ligase
LIFDPASAQYDFNRPPPPLSIYPLAGIGEIHAGDDLASVIGDALRKLGAGLEVGDILVVTSKIVSKAEGRQVDLAAIRPGARAVELAEVTRKDPRLVELVLSESTAVVRAVPHVLITRHRLGLVMANGGIDQSNTGVPDTGRALLLPEDPDRSAEKLRDGIARIFGVMPGVILSDSFGRPWRMGVVNVGIGASGLPALIDRRGEQDRDGRTLEVTQIAVADLIASAAGLVMGEGAEGVPAALIRGYGGAMADSPASTLVRPEDQDLFR